MEPREAVPRKWGRGGGLKATRNLQRESLGGGIPDSGHKKRKGLERRKTVASRKN